MTAFGLVRFCGFAYYDEFVFYAIKIVYKKELCSKKPQQLESQMITHIFCLVIDDKV